MNNMAKTVQYFGIIGTILILFLSCDHIHGDKEGSDKQQPSQCARDDGDCRDRGNSAGDKSFKDAVKHRYSRGANEKWNNILEEIEKALDNYGQREGEWNALSGGGDCSLYTELIDKDLAPFRVGITSHMIQTSRQRGSLYQIIDGKLFREKSCKFPARCAGVEHFLKRIVRSLPNMEFVVNTSDWPQISSHFPEPMPVFSFSKSKDYADITYPAWTFWEGGPSTNIYPKGIGRWDLLRQLLISTSKKYPWDKKENKAFFRGSRTSPERDALVYLSRRYPDLVDAKYTKNQAWKSDADTLNVPAATEVAFEDHCTYKYLFNYRGVAASFRFKHLFLCKSLVFHVGEEWIEFFYPELKPWVHYIPVDPRASEDEIRTLIIFAKENDDIVAPIAERGYNFVRKYLKMKHISCYWNKLLLKYSKLLRYDVKKPAEDAILL